MRSRLGSVEVQTRLLVEGSGRRAEGYCFDAPLSLATCSTRVTVCLTLIH